jgi:hypothetical protein
MENPGKKEIDSENNGRWNSPYFPDLPVYSILSTAAVCVGSPRWVATGIASDDTFFDNRLLLFENCDCGYIYLYDGTR